MGSIYAALLAAAGNDVLVVDAWAEHVAAIQTHGLRVEGASGDRRVRVEALTDVTGQAPVDLVVIATKAMDVRAAATSRAFARRRRHPRAADPERPRLCRRRRRGARRRGRADRRRGRLRGVARRPGARAPPRHGARSPRRAAWSAHGARRAARGALARGRVRGRDLRRRRSTRLAEARVQRLVQRHLRAPRPDDRGGAGRARTPGTSPRPAAARRTPSPSPPAWTSRSTIRSPTSRRSARGSPARDRRSRSTSAPAAQRRSTS